MKIGSINAKLITIGFLFFPVFSVMADSYSWIKVYRLDTREVLIRENLPLDQDYFVLEMVANQLVIIDVQGNFYNDSPVKQAEVRFRKSWGYDLPDYVQGWHDTVFTLGPKQGSEIHQYLTIRANGACEDTLSFSSMLITAGSADFLFYSLNMILRIKPMDPDRYVLPRMVVDPLRFSLNAADPVFSPGTSNRIEWTPASGNSLDMRIDQSAYFFPVKNRQMLYRAVEGFYKRNESDTLRSVLIENLEDAEQYGYVIFATFTDKDTALTFSSDIIYSIQDDTPPDPVTDPHVALDGGDGAIALWWDPVPDEGSGTAYYRIYRASDTGFEIPVDSVGADAVQGDSLVWNGWIDPEVSYFFRVRGVDYVGNLGDGDRTQGIFLNGSDGIETYGDGFGTCNPDTAPSLPYPYRRGVIDTLITVLAGWEKSVRFISVRDDSLYFENPPSRGMRVFDSGWIEPRNRWIFDYSYSHELGTRIDPNFVDNHVFYRKVYRKTVTGNIIESPAFPVAVDCLPPSDIRNLTVFGIIEDPDAENPHTGYRSWLMDIRWEHSSEIGSGFRRYHLYRKIVGLDPDFREVQLSDPTRNVFHDSFSPVPTAFTNPVIIYKVAAEDKAGNIRTLNETRWEAEDRALNPPPVEILNAAGKDTLFSDADRVRLLIGSAHFEKTLVDSYAVCMNDKQEYVLPSDTLSVTLSSVEFSRIKVRAIYHGNRSSIWSKTKVVSSHNRRPAFIRTVREENDWNGDIRLQWNRGSLDKNRYRIFRREGNGNWKVVAESVISDLDTVRWIDRYGWDEMRDEAGDTLVAYQEYQYRVHAYDAAEQSDFSEVVTSYCDRPPDIAAHRMIFIGGRPAVTVQWERALPSLAEQGWKTEIRVFQDSLSGPIVRQAVVVNQLAFTDTGIVAGHNLIYQVKEFPDYIDGTDNYSDPRTSSWSKPYTVSLLLLEPFILQPQPGGSIYVYWDSDIVERVQVDSFLIIRIQEGSGDSLLWKFGCSAVSMNDSLSLEHAARYRYEIYATDSLSHFVAFNSGEAICDTGAVFIPDISVYENRYFNDDSIWVRWVWRDVSLVPVRDTRGAVVCTIQASVSPGFPEDPGRTVTDGPFAVTGADTAKKVAIPELTGLNNKILYFRITARDMFGNPENEVWSTSFFGPDSAIFDPVPPGAVTDLHIGKVTALDFATDTVIAFLSWSGKNVEWPSADSAAWMENRQRCDLDFNIYGYTILRFCSTATDTLRFFRSGEHQYTWCDTLTNTETSWSVLAVDSAFNTRAGDKNANIHYLRSPLPPRPIDYRSCGVFENAGLPDSVEFYFEIAMDSTHFYHAYRMDPQRVDRILARSGWIDTTFFRCPSGWGSIETDTTWFRMKIRSGKDWESGWSLILCYAGNASGDAKDMGDGGGIPATFQVFPNYPNPFNGQTVVKYQLPESGHITARLYNIRGELVKGMSDEDSPAGYFSMRWDGCDEQNRPAATGIYLLYIEVREHASGRVHQKLLKMMMMK